jgi:hypothetical protein
MLLLAFTAITRWRRLVVRFASLLAIAMAVLSLGPQLHVRGHVFRHINLPERWIANLPLLNNMLVSRLMLYVYLCAGLLVAVALDGIWRTEIPGHKSRRRTVYAVLTITAVTVSYALVFPDVGFPATPATVPTFFSSGLVRRVPANSVALVAPFARDTNTSEPMLWQAVADMRYRTPAGYATGRLDDGQFGFLPEPTPLSKLMQDIQYGHPIRALDDGTRAELIAELRADHVATVIVGPFDTRDNMVELFTRLLSRPPEHVGGVDIWWHVT